MTRIGVLTGLAAERRLLDTIPAPHSRQILVGLSAADPARARAAAGRLIAEGARGLVSFGIAGGLAGDLRPGDLVVPQAVILPDGGRIATDEAWRRHVESALGGANIPYSTQPLAGSDRIVGSPAEKQALYKATAAVAVDMESHIAADAARRSGLPFIAIRAVGDTAGQVLPEYLGRVVKPGGGTDLGAVLRHLLTRPADVPATLRVALQTRKALAALRRVVRLGGGFLDLPGQTG